jgi:hypothetical protein
MSKHEKLIEKLLKQPNNFTYNEMVSLLKGFGYTEEERGRSSGSAVMFYHKKTKDKIMFHKPHPEKELKKYLLKLILEKLRANRMI